MFLNLCVISPKLFSFVSMFFLIYLHDDFHTGKKSKILGSLSFPVSSYNHKIQNRAKPPFSAGRSLPFQEYVIHSGFFLHSTQTLQNVFFVSWFVLVLQQVAPPGW